MENLPVEVVGNILSRLGAARDMVLASGACRKWRDAFCYHLDSLSFNFNDSPVYSNLVTSQIENLITLTIFQTKGLQGLSILMDDDDWFCASAVTAWLLHTRESLKSLYYNIRTSPDINIFDICGRRGLESLVVAHNTIMGIEPNYQRFPCLSSLSLSYVTISALDLNLLLRACPKIETLSLSNLVITVSDDQVASVNLYVPTLKTIYVETINLDKFDLEARYLEELHLKDCVIEKFNLIRSGSLKHFKVDSFGGFSNLALGEAVENLVEVDVCNSAINWLRLYQIISRSSRLRFLRLWDVMFEEMEEIDYLEMMAKSFPCLTKLSFNCFEGEDSPRTFEDGAFKMQNLSVLEVGWTAIDDDLCPFLENLLEKCPNLKKLIIHGTVSIYTSTPEECQTLGDFTSSMVRLMRKYTNVDVHFKYD